jgi:hypothetical protein
MTQPPSAQEIAPLGHALMLGTRKRPVALPPSAAALLPAASPLSPVMLALVLAGQHARFERPAMPSLTPATQADLAVHADTRPMLSVASRRLLKQLLGMAKGDAPEAFLAACRDRAASHGLRLHPFDLPALAPYMRNAADSQAAGPADTPATLDAATWTAMPQEHRADALRRLRHASPDAARALLEATFRSETIAHRAAFLGVMAVNLTAADLPFLEAAAKDRAEAVRTVATRLAGSIPGTDAYRDRLSLAAGMFITRGVTDKAERKKSLSSGLALMKGVAGHNAFQTLEGLRLEDLAGRLGMTRDAFVEALPLGEDIIVLPLLPAAAAEGAAALCTALIRRLSGPRALVTLWTHRPDGLDAPDHARPALIEALLDLAVRGQFPDAQTLHTYYRVNRGPLPDALAARLLASASWLSHVSGLAAPNADNKTPNVVKETALLIPDGQLPAFLAAISPLSPHLTLPARLFAEFCQSLAGTTPVAPLKPST